MSEMIEGVPQFRKRARLLHEIAFSIYFPRLLMMVNDLRSIQHPSQRSWVDDLQLLMAGVGRAPSYHFAFTFLWAMSAAVLFLCLRMLARFSISDVFLRTFAGIVAVIGFPLAAGYISYLGYLHMLGSIPRALLYAYAPYRWLAIEVMAALVCVLLYVFLKWPSKARWGLLLLGLHFAVWTWLVLLGFFSLVYPLLGFLASLAWGLYVRQSAESPRPPKLLPAQ